MEQSFHPPPGGSRACRTPGTASEAGFCRFPRHFVILFPETLLRETHIAALVTVIGTQLDLIKDEKPAAAH